MQPFNILVDVCEFSCCRNCAVTPEKTCHIRVVHNLVVFAQIV